jgi:hypothetical protein
VSSVASGGCTTQAARAEYREGEPPYSTPHLLIVVVLISTVEVSVISRMHVAFIITLGFSLG